MLLLSMRAVIGIRIWTPWRDTHFFSQVPLLI